MKTIVPYKYQIDYAEKVSRVLLNLGVALLYADTRTGKTPISLLVANNIEAKKVLFVTPKKAIPNIEVFARQLYPDKVTVINYESLHKIDERWFDLIIADESHTLGAHPQPSLRTRKLKEIVERSMRILGRDGVYVLLMSATPALETPAQYYHQFWVACENSPFWQLRNFYIFAQRNLIKEVRKFNRREVPVWKRLRPGSPLMEVVGDYTIRLTKEMVNGYLAREGREGFGGIDEEFREVDTSESYKKLVEQFIAVGIARFKDGKEIRLSTPVKRMAAFAQLSSGGIKVGEDDYRVFDNFKGLYIRESFKGRKIAVFYLYIAERKMLERTLRTTMDIKEWENDETNELVYVAQFRSSSLGTNLSSAEFIVFVNIPFSASTFAQVRERGRLIGKTASSKLIWVFSAFGIEKKVLAAVRQKTDYNTKLFQRDFGFLKTNKKFRGKV